MNECKRSGKIPAFGNWDYANDLPITQYFECARQAGLLRFSSSSGECDLHVARSGDLYAVDFNKPHLPLSAAVPLPKKKGHPHPHVKEQMRKQIKVCDVTDPPRKQLLSKQKQKQKQNNNASKKFKAVDEDLYKISPDLLHSSKPKKLLGFISRCLAPACMV